MMLIRPVRLGDIADILQLSAKTGIGLTSLPKDEAHLRTRIERSVATWEGRLDKAEQGYLFVLEDVSQKKVVGVSALEVAVGLSEPWYNFRLGTLVHASKSLNIYKPVPTLYLSNDHTGYSELCTLFLDPDFRHSRNGQLLSKVRFLFMAAFRDKFSAKVIAEMRGVSDDKGHSPFWDSLGKHFFGMEFAEADRLTGLGQKSFIAELMPKHPLYTDLLSLEARAVIGEVHPQTAPARSLLETEGLRYQGYVDIFDGGPTLEGDVDSLRAVRESRLVEAIIKRAEPRDDETCYLVANENYADFRAGLVTGHADMSQLTLDPHTAEALGIKAGHVIRAVPLFPEAGQSASTRQLSQASEL
ncbi:arginine N-succinyltransferase [Rouxiella chamberiensis]|uniref:Arginine N-succinyltransferase n=1 Tax=Rouxiella chamberiensis TaxID=1513468 RepID=A0ABY7HTB5_9GAMM|nr:arginine N-succinyltransferase [Rouxiella chamberiensis]WAT02659.1 arginine N-succinyltransferase [Rouxiella chamberiensis]